MLGKYDQDFTANSLISAFMRPVIGIAGRTVVSLSQSEVGLDETPVRPHHMRACNGEILMIGSPVETRAGRAPRLEDANLDVGAPWVRGVSSSSPPCHHMAESPSKACRDTSARDLLLYQSRLGSAGPHAEAINSSPRSVYLPRCGVHA